MAGHNIEGAFGEITVIDAIAKIKSTNVKSRADGLADLEHIFKNGRHSKLAILDDKSWHTILETLFEIAVTEKRNYLKAKSSATEARVLTKLTSTSSALRVSVEVGSPKLKKKTVKAVIDHVIGILPNSAGEYCSPISQDYLKALRAVLAHKPHVENLPTDQWEKVVKFCINGINRHYTDGGRESSLSRTSSFIGESHGSSKRSISQMKISSSRSNSSSTTIRNLEELLHCLLALVSAPNYSLLLKHARSISSSVFQVVKFAQAPTIGSSHQVAFAILNLVLMSAAAEQTAMLKDLAKDLVPLIARLWPTKMTSVKDEMLCILLGVHLHLESVLGDGDCESLETDIRYLSEVLKLEYSKRLDREQLQLDDIDLATLERTATTTAPLSFLRFRPHNLRAERNWMFLKVVGILDRLGHLKVSPAAVGDENEDEGAHPRKRRRITQHADEVMDIIKSVETSKRLTALQTLPFLLQTTQLPEKGLSELIESLMVLMTDDSSSMASWAMLGIASCTTQAAVHNNKGLFDWTQTWHIGGRLVTSSAYSRAACHLLHVLLAKDLVKYHDIAEEVSAMIISPELSGPAILADSTLSLMTHLLHIRNMEMPGASSTASQSVIRWAFTRWNPIDGVERSSATNITQVTGPIDFINLLRVCLAMPRLKLATSRTTPCTPIGQAWHRVLASDGMLRYLLLLDDNAPVFEQCPNCPKPSDQHKLESFTDTNAHIQTSRRKILELCFPKLEALVRYWETSVADRSKQISAGAVSGALFTFLIGSYIVSLSGTASQHYLAELKKHLTSLTNTAISFTRGEGKESQTYDEMLLQAIHPYLPSCQSLESDSGSSLTDSCFLDFIHQYAEEIKNRRSAFRDASDDQIDDDDDDDDSELMEDGFGSPQRASKFEPLDDLPREELSLATSAKAFTCCTSLHVVLVSAVSTSQTVAGSAPPAFVDHLLALRPAETLLCRNLLQDIFESKLILDDADASRLLDHYAGMLEKNDYRNCEIVQGICLEILLGTTTIWTNNEKEPCLLAEVASNMYESFTDAALKCSVSPSIMVGVATLLIRLIPLESRLPSPSPLSNLLEVLKNGENQVKFHIGARLPEVFENFVLKEHERIFDDVLDKLPADPDFGEEFAFRMHVFALLGAKWSTLIRKCVYHIFECPGRIPNCSDHAARCFAQVSTALGLGSARELFHLFASQLLYTWLEAEEIDDIPFQVFGYGTLIELVRDTQADITAIMTMRAQDKKVEILSTLLEVSTKTLLQQSFTKVMAYAISYDLSTPPKEGVSAGEVRVRGILGKENYLECMNDHFAEIIATFFCTTNQDESLARLFSRHDYLNDASNALDEMKQISSSQLELPPNHQPTFKVKYLCDDIEFVCSRAQREPPRIYTSTMLSFIARRLFDLIHPSLGSLHACAVLRKVRILVCIAGPAALKGYPLEMLLQSLRPYLTNPECVEDVIGVVQYLFVHGSPHLSQSPSFVSGIALSILASLRVFLKTSQASTTQESQYKSMMSKAEDFHRWLGDYLKAYDSPLMSESSKISFQEIVRSAHGIRAAGNVNIDSPESNLLMGLLKDERSGSPLLSRPSRDLAFALLCNEFIRPDSCREDTFGSDDTATKYAAVIWNLCRSGSVSENFLAWGAKVIGRAFVANGHIHEELLRESEMSRIKELSASDEVRLQSSSSILRLLQALTLGNDHKEVGLAESALRVLLSTLEKKDQNRLTECQQSLSESLCQASSWSTFEIPPSDQIRYSTDPKTDPFSADAITCKTWLEDLSVELCLSGTSDVVLSSLPRLLRSVKGFAEQAFPFILHSVLADQFDEKPTAKKALSAALRHWLNCEDVESCRNVKLLLNAILYLRTQPFPNEISHADRVQWLDIDYWDAARAAIRCNMFKTALLFIETCSAPTTRASRRSSAVKNLDSTDLQLSIFRNIDEPDSFYGVSQGASLSSVLSRLEYEKDGFKSLSFRGAQYDSNLRRKDPAAAADADSLVNALGILRLDGLSHSLVSAKQTVGMSSESRESMFRTARKLEQWDIPVPESSLSDAGTIYRAFQVLNNVAERKTITAAIDDGLREGMKTLMGESLSASALHTSLQSLSILTEMDEVISSNSSQNFEEMTRRFEDRAGWMQTGRFDDISHIISCRDTLLSSLSHRQPLRDIMKINTAETRLVEVRTTLLSSGISRAHGALQESLASATYLTELIQPCHNVGIDVDAAVNLEAANALWDLGEMTSSIGLLRELNEIPNLKNQAVVVNKSDLLAKLGYQISTARLEMPDQIITNYLQPALAALKGKDQEKESGKVYHEFAAFCDQQLQDPDDLEYLERLRKLREEKHSEVSELTRLSGTSEAKRKQLSKALRDAKQWYDIDNLEYTRLSDSRARFLRQSLENYLLALTVSDDHDKDALRFSAIWLEHSDVKFANEAVSQNITKVPTRKFTPLMNQLTSRLLERNELFQKLLFELVLSICQDHPYHGMYQIWAGTKSMGNSKDETAKARQAATKNLAMQLKRSPSGAIVWGAIDQTSKAYCILAEDDGTKDRGVKYKERQKVALKDSVAGKSFSNMISRQNIPPPTMHIEIAANRDYSDLPVTRRVEPTMDIASGLSAPKIVTLLASNGKKYKQLVKGSNDDLRQDAIMEQVFAQVSTILQSNRATSQRSLIIRTYKVIPLTHKAGIIEFVPNSVPLHNYLLPAHPRYHPKDMSVNAARTAVLGAQNKSSAERLRVFRNVTEKFHPVMRYFFMEKFDDPDEWFGKRLAYTRSTAANSMLGHILGLGDRHGHNILIDEKTGEAVHIDFGFAFETGRVLPVPELVPFRLTRDIVDGMGITGTEGVFRRCCEFTLEALRKEAYSIMTVLDVLRYDPLYSWSVSPVRLSRLQKEQEQGAASDAPADATDGTRIGGRGTGKLTGNEPSEANRALTVVRKKLSKTLSVEATVNDLINQATDERNLAFLFAGWAAYA